MTNPLWEFRNRKNTTSSIPLKFEPKGPPNWSHTIKFLNSIKLLNDITFQHKRVLIMILNMLKLKYTHLGAGGYMEKKKKILVVESALQPKISCITIEVWTKNY